jgi:magnesium transporter
MLGGRFGGLLVLTTFGGSGARCVDCSAADSGAAIQAAVWIDLFNPTPEETRAVESALSLQLPTRREAQEIEVSSRLYVEDRTVFMTATVIVGADTPRPETTPVTFVFQPKKLVTLRFAQPTPFTTFATKFPRTPAAFPTAQRVLVGIVDEIVDRIADILEAIGIDLNAISGVVFTQQPAVVRKPAVDYTAVLTRIGHNGELAANARESLVSLGRVAAYFGEALPSLGEEPLDEHWRTAGKDVTALTDHATFLSNKVNFFLDATLGLVNIEQNTIIKMFSVLAVIFLPPTLIASIYGMNFEHLPELHWRLGYAFSLALMLLSAVLPYAFFKRKGWL